MSKQAKQRKQKGRQLGGLEATHTTGLDGDQLLLLAGSLISYFFFTNSFSETKSQTSLRKLYEQKVKSCDAEIKLTHKIELLKIQRINPNIDS
jgi:hypothetical protein